MAKDTNFMGTGIIDVDQSTQEVNFNKGCKASVESFKFQMKFKIDSQICKSTLLRTFKRDICFLVTQAAA